MISFLIGHRAFVTKPDFKNTLNPKDEPCIFKIHKITMIVERGGLKKIYAKIWEKIPIRPDPPCSRWFRVFLIQHVFEKFWSPPLGSNLDIFEFENILVAAHPLGQTYEKCLFRHAFTVNWAKSSVLFFFFEWGLRVI